MKIYKRASYPHTNAAEYVYLVEPKANLRTVMRNGLFTYHPNDGPGSYVDDRNADVWPDQEYGEATYRCYFAADQWECPLDRFRIRVPVEAFGRKERIDIGNGRTMRGRYHVSSFDL